MLTIKNIKKIVHSKYFERFILFVILSAGVLVGAQTYPAFSAQHHDLIVIFDTLIIIIFVIEAILKIASEIPHPLKYFKSSWNVFDFIIVVGVLLLLEGSFLPVLHDFRTF